MNSINLKAYAKLNLSLSILPKVKNGYHQVKLLNCELDLADEIKIKKTGRDIVIKCQWQENDCYDTSCPENCLAFQAAKLLQKKFPKKIKGVEILIDKEIPAKVGLGGGSADGATVLKGINKLCRLNLSKKQLLKTASQVSSDACYSVIGGLCKVEGKGEKVTPLKYKLPKYYAVVVVPTIKKPSTAWAYKNLDHKKIGKNLDKFGKLVSLLRVTSYKLQVTRFLHNDFEDLIFKRFPETKKIKEDLLAFGAENAILAGSGLAVVGFFEEKSKAKKALKFFKKDGKDIYLTKIK